MTGEIERAALHYASCGLPVIPLNGKTPVTEHAYRDGTTDQAQVAAWFKKWPHANVGIVLGDVCVLDIDARSGGDRELARLGELPPTLTVDTGGGGQHYYFKPDPRAVRKELAPGVELKPSGGYVVAPPSIHPVTVKPYIWRGLEQLPAFDVAQLAALPEWVLALCAKPKPAAPVTPGPIPEGSRNNTLARLAVAMRRKGSTANEILAAITVANVERCDPPLEDAELVQIADGVEHRYEPIPEPTPAPAAQRQPFNLTDLGNAERFTAQHGHRVRYCAANNTWLVWDTRRWAPDRDDELQRLAILTVRATYSEAEKLDNADHRRALVRHATQSESQRRVAAMLVLARSLKPIAARPETFDAPATSFLLNVMNGTLDLRTGELREHRPDDYITRLAPVEYIADAQFDLWDRFLEQQVPDPDLRAFLPRAAGSTLTGETGDEKLFFVHGQGAGGKSTFTEAVKSTLGEYASTTGFETFLRRRGDAGVRDDIARLAGARMVLSLEVDEGRAFDAAALKNLTGGDTVTARHLFQRFFEFKPAFKLWLVANHRPHASAPQDAALWRRVLVVPFTRIVPEDERDAKVKAELIVNPAARRAILAWAVRGCLEWQRLGLQPPKAVGDATRDYRDSCDTMGRFMAECFHERPADGKVSRKEMRERYVTWCAEGGENTLGAKVMGEALRELGLAEVKIDGERFWRWPPAQRRAEGRQGQQNPEPSSVSASQGDFTEKAALNCPLPSADDAVERLTNFLAGDEP